jgi:hypothetical protein
VITSGGNRNPANADRSAFGRAARDRRIRPISSARLDRHRRIRTSATDPPELPQEVGNRAGEAVKRYNIARIYWSLGDLDRAISELARTVELDRQVDHPDLHSDTTMLERLRAERSESGPGRS